MIQALLELEPLIRLVMLSSLRIGACFTAMPAPFGELAPVRTRAMLTVLVALVLTTSRIDSLHPPQIEAAALIPAAVNEIIVGAVIGLTVRIILAVGHTAGTFAGFSMGLGFAAALDPLTMEQSLPPARLLNAFSTMIFFVLNGHHQVIAGLSHSYTVAPPGEGALEWLGADLIGMTGELVAQGLRVASPVMATMFILQLGTGFVAKSAPRIQLFALAFTVAGAFGTLSLFLSAQSVTITLTDWIRRMPSILQNILGGG